MSQVSIANLTELSASPAVGDWFVVVDISDPSQSALGTTKKISAAHAFLTSPIINTDITIGTRQTSAVAYVNIGDGTANEPTWGLAVTSILNIASAISSAHTTGSWVHAHLLTKQTIATTGTIQGLEAWTWCTHTSGTVGTMFGLIGNMAVSGVGGTVTNALGVTGGIIVSGGTVTNVYGIAGGIGTVDGASSVVTNGYGVHSQSPTVSNGGTITNLYGLYVNNMTAGGTLNYAIYTNTGKVRFGDQVLTSAGTTARASINLPHGVAPTSPVDGDMWTQTTGLYVRINGVTVGPLS